MKKCYEQLYILPAIDEIHVEQNKVSLIIFEPHSGTGLHPDLQGFYNNCPYKNRVLFLSGQRNVMEKLYYNAKRLAAIRQILANMKSERVPEGDQQYKEAENQEHKATTALLATIRETFVTLHYPIRNALSKEDIKFEFRENRFNGEEQIINALIDAQKFEDLKTEDFFIENLRKKAEQRIFTQKEMPWSQILERAATETSWQWFHPRQMDELKKKCLNSDAWREISGYMHKGPFEKEATDVSIEETGYDEQSGEFTLRVRPIRGDRVYYDYGAEPSKASNEVLHQSLTITEPLVHFVCIDSSENNPHPTGTAKKWLGKAPLRREQRQNADGKNVLEMQTHKDYQIRYTTDGSNPKENGGLYSGEIVLPDDCKYVRTAVYFKDILVNEVDIPFEKKSGAKKALTIKDDMPLEYELKSRKKCTDTEMTYTEFAKLKQLKDTFIRHFAVTLTDKADADNYMEISSAKVPWDAANLQDTVEFIRDSAFAGKEVEVEFEYRTILCAKGSAFREWVEANKLDASELAQKGEIKQ